MIHTHMLHCQQLPTTAVLTSNAAYNAVSRYGRDDKVELQDNDAYPVSVAENSAYQTGGTAISTSGNTGYSDYTWL